MNKITFTFNSSGENKFERNFSYTCDVPVDASLTEYRNIFRNISRLLGFSDELIDEMIGEYKGEEY